MPIDFELSPGSQISLEHYGKIAREQMRPLSRKYDLAEHTLPTEWVDGVPSESERVAGAVEHLEGEMRAAPLRANAPTG